MKVTCDVIRDLLPLYHDGVCSEDTKKMIEEHLSECSDCKEYLENLDELTGSDPSVIIDSEKAKSNTIKGIKKKILRKNVIVGLCVFVLSAGVLFGGYTYIMHYETPIDYTDDLISIKVLPVYEKGEKVDNIYRAVFNGKNYYGTYAGNHGITQNGKPINAAFIQYTDTIWTRHTKYKFESGDREFDLSDEGYVEENNKVRRLPDPDIIYYVPADIEYDKFSYDHYSVEDYDKLAEKCIVLWER